LPHESCKRTGNQAGVPLASSSRQLRSVSPLLDGEASVSLSFTAGAQPESERVFEVETTMRRIIGAAIVGLVCAGTVTAQTPPAPRVPAAGVRTVATVMDVMKTMTIPFSDAVFEAGSEPPKDAAAWEAVREKAVALAEAGNLLMLGARVADRGAWMKYSRAQVDAAEVAAKAASAKNAEQLSAAADAVYETCAACHKDYLK
jgi:hypothetical protein